MSEEQALVPVDPSNLGALVASDAKYANDQALTEVTKVGDYLPFIQLMGGESREVKRGEFPIGHFCLRKGKQNIDLGKSMIVLILGWRPKAMIFSETPVSYFDPNLKEFKEIVATADVPSSGKGFGPEFLLWLPDQKCFATYFLASKTGRNESPNIKAVYDTLKKGEGRGVAKIEAHVIENAQYTWHGPKTFPYDLDIVMPDQATLIKERDKFNNPQSSVKEAAEPEEASSSRR